ncbi:hypothetical protein [Methylotenera mobilis]|uniref:Carboxypeptidase regulatory-like domain-containing protein n=1 Tax=Methylotenera mobilis (strain JLW8 / ATCC BAA-1282 / DSM 17540) TaxID=583345 RepID=C6WWJ4_METML|nr:hypothetical protein [Methylotenera mobilis]ACT48293.1 hypothetical protein Mmol_1387 [Methylotenera mobilis JLW8]
MSYLKHILIAAAVLVSILTATTTYAYTTVPEEMIPEDAAEPDMSAVTPVTEGDVTYLTGGIGKAESVAMRGNAKNYALEIVFVEKSGALEEYLSEVKLQIIDSSKNTVLDIDTQGPYFLANLPQGKYQVSAEYNGVVKTQLVSVSKKKHSKLIFWWRMAE